MAKSCVGVRGWVYYWLCKCSNSPYKTFQCDGFSVVSLLVMDLRKKGGVFVWSGLLV